MSNCHDPWACFGTVGAPVANAVALQTVADQTQALHALRRRGIEIPAQDLAHLSPYPTGRVKRFGEYPDRVQTDAMPRYRELPPGSRLAQTPAG